MSPAPDPGIRVGVSLPPGGFASRDEAADYVGAVADGGLDHLLTADHIAFFRFGGENGTGFVELARL